MFGTIMIIKTSGLANVRTQKVKDTLPAGHILSAMRDDDNFDKNYRHLLIEGPDMPCDRIDRSPNLVKCYDDNDKLVYCWGGLPKYWKF